MSTTARLSAVGAAALLALTTGTVSAQGSAPSASPEAKGAKQITVTSKAFHQGAKIPKKYTCDGADVSPPLKWRHIPKRAKKLALVVDDPDAPGGTWTHWVVLDIAKSTRGSRIGKVPKGGVQAKNSWGDAAYGGPCPPSGTHRYRFKLYALDHATGLRRGAPLKRALRAVSKHAIKHGKLMGRYTAK
ncbi:YbhB/YbcL family Raf kinase inhibitor-like protein [Solicola gregarius]|uniref:YbhB/YbcL family Raf kinase inhibitor-like protein n=1 Tax=Solicola gregarius TaxID=2908642 RepID=A0AA46TIH6_9ACTN|nr:YbhB/YbcL family Raf kinase inhibitor-like protein [Solicola gregarius]UYM05138.1 YbhB/YbcL family Raf kinase inhibitor-like protein [Solicola gregarius]